MSREKHDGAIDDCSICDALVWPRCIGFGDSRSRSHYACGVVSPSALEHRMGRVARDEFPRCAECWREQDDIDGEAASERAAAAYYGGDAPRESYGARRREEMTK